MWPAQTKQQGYKIYNDTIGEEWQEKKQLKLGTYGVFDLTIYPEVNFSNTYSRFIDSIKLKQPEQDLKKEATHNRKFPANRQMGPRRN